MNAFLHNAAAYLTTLGMEYDINLPFVHFPQRQVSFHLAVLSPCSEAAYFQQMSIDYEARGVRLIHLWEDVWNTQQPLVEMRIQALFGRSDRVFARHTAVQRIDKLLLRHFMQRNHLHGSPQARYKYGLFYRDALLAAASFSARRPMPQRGAAHNSYELVRFANLASCTVVGGLSKLLAHFIRDVRPDDIMTYADRDWSAGKSYERLGFTFLENTRPQAFLIHPDEQVRYYPHRLPEGMTADTLRQQGYFTIYNAGNKKYVSLQKNDDEQN
ncbi:MAG: hypothetical protein LBT48_02205 [Prevotellaceae bacterium]|jgi:hypothetical protein|nr:hypothetical protein [Prevotellaceae bacterium]